MHILNNAIAGMLLLNSSKNTPESWDRKPGVKFIWEIFWNT